MRRRKHHDLGFIALTLKLKRERLGGVEGGKAGVDEKRMRSSSF